jgi:hypothetical protein
LHELDWRHWPVSEWHACRNAGTHAIGVKPTQIPEKQRTPVMTYVDGLFMAGLFRKSEKVCGQM